MCDADLHPRDFVRYDATDRWAIIPIWKTWCAPLSVEGVVLCSLLQFTRVDGGLDQGRTEVSIPCPHYFMGVKYGCKLEWNLSHDLASGMLWSTSLHLNTPLHATASPISATCCFISKKNLLAHVLTGPYWHLHQENPMFTFHTFLCFFLLFCKKVK